MALGMPHGRMGGFSGGRGVVRGRLGEGRGFSAQPDEDSYDQESAEERDPNIIDASEITGVDLARSRLISWLSKIHDSSEQELNPITITIGHSVAKQEDSPIGGYDHDLGADVSDTVEQILTIAINDIAGYPQTAATLSYSASVDRTQLKGNVAYRLIFTLHQPKMGNALQNPPTRQHHATSDGLLGMLMNQNLQVTQFALEKSETGKESLEQQNKELRRENYLLKQQQFAVAREWQELLSTNLKRRMMTEEHESKLARDAMIGDTFKSIAPFILTLALPPEMRAMVQHLLSRDSGGNPAAMARPPAQVSIRGPGVTPNEESEEGDGNEVPDESRIIDELIVELQADEAFLVQLVGVLQQKPRCGELFMTLYNAACMRHKAAAGA